MKFPFGHHCLVGLVLLAFTGCVNAGKARKDAQAAFRAGEQEAERRFRQSQEMGAGVAVNGPVRKNSIPWRPNLTLSQAIIEAEYMAVGEPAEIFVVRAGVAYRIDLQTLLSGRDMTMQPGDIVQLNPANATPAR